MKKIISCMISIMFLLSCMLPVTVLADSQSTMVKYSVPARVVYKDYDGSSTTQKVEVGTILKAPKAKGKPGCLFEGWKNEQTGLLWDFALPVTEHMTLTASYSELKEDVHGNISIGKGKFSVRIRVENHTTDVSVGTSSKDLLNMLIADGSITSDELEQIADGATMEIILVVKDGTSTITEASKNQMKQAAEGYTIGQYLDISLMKYLTVNGDTGKGQLISQTSGMITVSVKIPDGMINTDKSVDQSYIVLRNHEGKVSTLDSEYHADTHMLTFQTNLFSDYAIAYKDVKKTGQTSGNADNHQKDNISGTAKSSPKTGDTSKLFRYGMLLTFSVLIMLMLLLHKKEEK